MPKAYEVLSGYEYEDLSDGWRLILRKGLAVPKYYGYKTPQYELVVEGLKSIFGGLTIFTIANQPVQKLKKLTEFGQAVYKSEQKGINVTGDLYVSSWYRQRDSHSNGRSIDIDRIRYIKPVEGKEMLRVREMNWELYMLLSSLHELILEEFERFAYVEQIITPFSIYDAQIWFKTDSKNRVTRRSRNLIKSKYKSPRFIFVNEKINGQYALSSNTRQQIRLHYHHLHIMFKRVSLFKT